MTSVLAGFVAIIEIDHGKRTELQALACSTNTGPEGIPVNDQR
jgi:hypothetical protein